MELQLLGQGRADAVERLDDLSLVTQVLLEPLALHPESERVGHRCELVEYLVIEGAPGEHADDPD